ncbi:MULTISPECIES: fluoride efflux transporter FluC [Prochlorococcus]|uniref:fluoride efflux transporter FluC n=1 Tax=Prochlorococcus TaxID=1218 RepID=UPI00055A31B4|nr:MULTISPECIES: CrcB family protein [Prochlorococcus]
MLKKDLLTLEKVLWVGMGAFPGGLARWLIGNDFAVNIFGTALLGLLMGLDLTPRVQLFLIFGFCGAFTTFSGWMVEVLELLEMGMYLRSFAYVFLLLIVSLSSICGGFLLGRRIKGSIAP